MIASETATRRIAYAALRNCRTAQSAKLQSPTARRGLRERVGSQGNGSDGIIGAVDQLFGIAMVFGEDDARARFDVKDGEQWRMTV